MRFEVPQFIEVEDKIFGPLTLKQFVYVAGGSGAVVLAYLFLPFILFLLVAPILGGLAAAFAFVPVNNRPFLSFVEAVANYIGRSRLYLWKKEPKKVTALQKGKDNTPQKLYVPPATKNTIASLARNLEIKTLNEKKQ